MKSTAAKENVYLSVAGVMGSGKTTVSRLISKALGFHLLEEQASENHFLPLYYGEPQKWALHSQLFYLREKAAQLKQAGKLLNSQSVVQDTPIYQDCFTYAAAQKSLGYLTDAEHTLYQRFFELLVDGLPAPHLIVQLDASPTVLLARIKKRDRVYEKSVTRDYLELLSGLQEEWISAHPEINILRVVTDNHLYDVLQNAVYQKTILQKIKVALARLDK